MSEVLNKTIVLALNALWQPIHHYTVQKAVKSMTSGLDGQPPLLALDMEFVLDEHGQPTEKISTFQALAWDDWIQLPVRPYDLFIQTGRGKIRVPTIVVARNFKGMPEYSPRPNSKSIRERDGGVCQYTGEYVGKDGNLDHVVPRDKGGRDTFENLVWCKKKVNSDKGNKLPHEAGLTLRRKPVAPKKVPRFVVMREVKHPTWKHFLLQK
jgi:hypothetical protein